MSERHIANSEPVEVAHHRKAVLNDVSAFQAQKRCYLSRTLNALDIVGCISQFQMIGIPPDLLVDCIDPVEGAHEPALRWEILRLNVDAKKHSSHPAAPE